MPDSVTPLAHVSSARYGVDTEEMLQLSSLFFAARNTATELDTSVRWAMAQAQNTARTRMLCQYANLADSPHSQLGWHSQAAQTLVDQLQLVLASLLQAVEETQERSEFLATALARASGLYSSSEVTILSYISGSANLNSLFSAGASTGLAASEASSSGTSMLLPAGSSPSSRAENFGFWYGTDAYQQDVLRLLSGYGEDGVRAGKQFAASGSPVVGNMASVLGLTGNGIRNAVYGGNLSVSPAAQAPTSLTGAADISGAYRNLEKLGNATWDKPHSTVAVQAIRNSDGQRSWVVYIPGTQTNTTAPIGWLRNLDLMSSIPVQRKQAASARFVEEAMRQAGVPATEPVALIGHSQGGIIAATLAEEPSKYSITHVITAGSPIAGHRIPENVRVTSSETQGELVSHLDAMDNPKRDNWVTVRGQMKRPENLPNTLNKQGLKMSDSPAATHGMNFHRANWQDAIDSGSPAAAQASEEFSREFGGEVEKTLFFEGLLTPDSDASGR